MIVVQGTSFTTRRANESLVRNVDGISRTFPIARNRHDRGILVETAVPAGVPEEVEKAAADLAEVGPPRGADAPL